MSRVTSLSVATPSMRGYIALMTVLILSTVLAVTSVSSGISAYISSAISLARNDHQTARFLADDCVRAELFSLAKDSSYTITNSLPIQLSSDQTCSIDGITNEAENIRLQTHGDYRSTTVRISAHASLGRSLSTVTSQTYAWFETAEIK